VVEGTLKVAIANEAVNGFTVSLETPKSVSEVKSLYLQKLKDDGWTITTSMDIQGSSSIVATKGKRTVTVGISPNQSVSNTIVTISTTTDTTPAAPNSNT
jgi:hypothetical protein